MDGVDGVDGGVNLCMWSGSTCIDFDLNASNRPRNALRKSASMAVVSFLLLLLLLRLCGGLVGWRPT